MNPSSSTSKSGSALLLTLLVVSLLMVVVLTFTVYVRVELRATETKVGLLKARQNAKLAMHLALAQLQRAAGADQRITARGKLISDSYPGGNRYWTGVWEIDSSGTLDPSPSWLVSGSAPDPAVLETERIKLFSENSLAPAVEVPTENIKDADGLVLGDYAYWISDEGVKVSVHKVDQEKRGDLLASERGLTPDEMLILPQVTPGRVRNEFLFSSIPDWDSINEKVLKTSSLDQLVFAGLSSVDLENNYHRAAWGAKAVIANTESGGLKQDLSFAGTTPLMDNFSKNPDLQLWIQNKLVDNKLTLTGLPVASPNPLSGQPVFTNPVVLTELGLYMRFSRLSSGNGLRFQISLRPELWNPYSFPVAVEPVDTTDLLFEITGLPELACTWTTGTSDATSPPMITQGTFNLDPGTLTFTTTDGVEETLESLSVSINQSNGQLDAGEVYRTSMKAETPIGISLTSDSTSTKSDDYMAIKAPASNVTIRVKNKNGELLQEFSDIPFPEFDTTGRRSSNDQLTGQQVSSRSFSDFQIVFHLRLEDETPNGISTDPAPILHWFSETDPRSLSIPHSAYNSSIAISDPDEAALNSLFQTLPDLFASAFRSFPAYDVPLGPPISIGFLQHLQFASTAPFSVGNAWGKENDGYGNPFNSYFDRYFFSTVPQTGVGYNPAGNMPLANTHLIISGDQATNISLPELRDPFSSKYFLIDGAFNINSSENLAWQAILGSVNLQNWDYEAEPDSRDLQYGLFRSPYGANLVKSHPHEEYPAYPEIDHMDKATWYRDRNTPLWANAFKVGMRELQLSEVKKLAAEITNRLKSRGIPFLSIRELADSELLQDAIDATTINTTDGKSYVASDSSNQIPKFSPAFVSQADILQLMAPFSTARSDTFTIRAYGNSENGINSISEQYCEVVVQRTSEPLQFRNMNNPLFVEQDYLNPPDEFGRRFKIVSFKWITP